MAIKTQFKYIHFIEKPISRKPSVWICHNTKHGEALGTVTWDSGWRQYVYFPACTASYSEGCLRDIAGFIDSLVQEGRR